MNVVQIVCLIIAVGLFAFSAVSLIRAIIAKRKRKHTDSEDNDNRKE